MQGIRKVLKRAFNLDDEEAVVAEIIKSPERCAGTLREMMD
jgi:hypothetical protein